MIVPNTVKLKQCVITFNAVLIPNVCTVSNEVMLYSKLASNTLLMNCHDESFTIMLSLKLKCYDETITIKKFTVVFQCIEYVA